jgi:hypothetical protein
MDEGSALLESDHARIRVHVQHRLVHVVWKGNTAGEAYREASRQVLKVIEVFGLKYFLSDARNMGPILFADREWSEREIIPRFVEAGLRRVAVVSSTDVLNMIAVDNMVASVPSEAPCQFAFFAEPAPALQWLYADEPVLLPVL